MSTPCPVCGSTTKACCATDDGLHLCRGNPVEGWKKLKSCDNGFIVYRRRESCKENAPVFLTEKKENPKIDWVPVVKKYTKRLDSFHRNLLSTRLKIPDNFDLFDVGVRVYNGKSAFTIPEQDKDGFTGISLRYEGEVVTKTMITGSRRGLCFPKTLMDMPDPVFVVEGFTDCAAMVSAGLTCIGRPSNVGGADMIAGLCRGRSIVVVGENDWRLCKVCSGMGCITCGNKGDLFPGKDGVDKVAKKLLRILGKNVSKTMPPKGFKDVRDFLTSLDSPWSERGKILIDNMGLTSFQN